MKTKIASLLVVIMITTTQCMAQKTITVRAENNDISNNLDLQAVATAFGESSNLEDFERRLNDYNSAISNLDLNNDGQVDYLRVIETYQDNAHVIVIQAVLGKDDYQDVATIVVDKNNNTSAVQVIGDPYLFGDNYIIDPVYSYTPSIFDYLWGSYYRTWYSPYYWGYYPNYYRVREPWDVDRYYSHIQSQINYNYHFYYTNRIRNTYVQSVIRRIGRDDYANRHPDRSFINRNQNYRNKNDFNTPTRIQANPSIRNNESVRRNTSPTWTGGDIPRRGGVNNGYNNNQIRTNSDNAPARGNQNNNNQRSNSYNAPVRSNYNTQNNSYRNQPAYTTPTQNSNNNNESRNNSYQQPQRNQVNTNQGHENRPIIRDNTTSRPAPVISQPKPAQQPRQVERQNTESNRNSSNNGNTERKTNNDSNRR